MGVQGGGRRGSGECRGRTAHLHPQVRLIGLTSSRSRLVGASAPTESEKEGWINNVCGLIRVNVRRHSQKCAAVSKIMTFVQYIS